MTEGITVYLLGFKFQIQLNLVDIIPIPRFICLSQFILKLKFKYTPD